MELPKRKTLRLPEYDYSSIGVYFVTICTKQKEHLLSDLRRGGALLRPLGKIVEKHIPLLPQRFGIGVDKYVIMPNHIHLLLSILDTTNTAPLSDILCAFKSLTTTEANRTDNTPGRQIWQRSYYDHIIHNEKDYLKIWEYIDGNPLKWSEDCYYSAE